MASQPVLYYTSCSCGGHIGCHPGSVALVLPPLPSFSNDFVQDALCAFHREVAHTAGAGEGREWQRVTNCEPNPAYADNKVFLSLPLSGPLYRIRISISVEECVE